MPPQVVNSNAVFLNVPYDKAFQSLYVAYIVGLYQLGLEPRIASGIPGGEFRLSRILNLIQLCRYSIHDLSRVELSLQGTGMPRFNMPLELGMTITWAELNKESHLWFVMETVQHRLDQSTSDLRGTDANIHSGTIEGVLSELRNAFVNKKAPPISRMLKAYRLVEDSLEMVMADAGTRNLFAASVFKEICFLAWKVAQDNSELDE